MSQKLKVAFIVSQFPCYDEAFILREIYALSKQTDIIIYSLKSSKDPVVHDQAQELLSKTVSVPYFFSDTIFMAHLKTFLCRPFKYIGIFLNLISGNLKSPEFLFKNLACFPKAVYMAELIKKEKVSNIHAYWATYPASVAWIISKLTGIPYSFTGHAHDIYLDTTYLAQKMMHAAFVITCTTQNKTHLMKVAPLYSERRIVINYHGLELDKFQVNGKVRNKTFEILSVGTLQEHKGFQHLIPALGILRDRALNFRCTIIGGGDMEEEIKKQIGALKLEPYITMMGALKQNEVLPYYKKSDLLVLMAQPEWHWGIPNVLIEALAAKTPVVTTQFGSVEELVKHRETGFIVPPKDPQKLADQIEELYRNDELRCQTAKAGHQLVVKEFDLQKNLQRFEERLSKYAASPVIA